LLGDSPLLQRLLRPEAVQALLEQHRDGKSNHTRELRGLAALALWARQAGVA